MWKTYKFPNFIYNCFNIIHTKGKTKPNKKRSRYTQFM